MRVLALDCSAKSVSVAIAENGKLIYEAFLNITLTHSETLMPMCEQALLNARCNLKDIDAIAVTAGPGSFTGIRIGISAVKGMCFNDEKPVFAYSTLDAMALAFTGDGGFNCILCGLMDARREQFYNALLKIENGSITRLCEDRVITKNELEAELETFKNKKIILIGDGALLFKDLCNKKRFALAPSPFLIQRAGGIAIDASSENRTTSPISAEALQPIYLRKSQAEREREAKLG